MPGSERSSWALHFDTMTLHHHDNRPGGSPLVAMGERARAHRATLRDGDSIGCVVDFVHHRLLFTLNDSIVLNATALHLDRSDESAADTNADADRDLTAHDWLALPLGGADEIGSLFPCIGMHSRGAVVTARFRPPFRFDFTSLLGRLRRRLVADRIARLPDPAPSLVAAVVSDRLAWAGFADVLQAASSDGAPTDAIALTPDGRAVLPRLPPPSVVSSERLAVRQQLRRALMGGHAREALDILTAFNASTTLRFNVGCIAIAQMAQADVSATVITNFAQEFVVPLRDCEPIGTPEHRRRHLLLRSAVGLLAYPSGGSRERAVADMFAAMPIQSIAASANSALLDGAQPTHSNGTSENGNAAGESGVRQGSQDEAVSIRALNIAQSFLSRPPDNTDMFAVPAMASSTATAPPPAQSSSVSMSAIEVLLRHRAALLAMLAASGSSEAALLLSGDVLH
jgi:hypothetical protein